MAPKARGGPAAKAKGKAKSAPKAATKAKAAPKAAAPKAKARAVPKARVVAKAKALPPAPKRAPSKKKLEEAPAPAPPAPKRAASKRKLEEAPAPTPKKARPEAKSAGAAGGRAVDGRCPKQGLSVIEEYSATLNQTNVGANNNKFYIIQALQGGGQFFAWNRWGRVGDEGQTKLMPCGTKESAIKEFESKFRDKTKNAWANKASFTKFQGKYHLVETDESSGSGGGGKDQALGKLTEQQIGKGQKALEKLATAIQKGKDSEMTEFSSEFYSLIPHNFGWKKPVAISSMDVVQEKEELLKFFLRMGFEQVEADKNLTPIDGVMDLPLPKSLDDAAGATCNKSQIAASNKKGKELEGKQAGKPAKKMDASLYAAIMLYTSNAIYADLNKCLRDKNRAKLSRYFKYLRLLLEAMKALPTKKTKLWRGLSVDLFKDPQYAVGETVTWWGVSSCTSDEKVAQNFAKGCGGDCTIVTVEASTSCDIAVMSFFANEKESLLRPGTQLKVKSRTKKGSITEIYLQEVGSAIA